MRTIAIALLALTLSCSSSRSTAPEGSQLRVGPLADGTHLVPTQQVIRPAGQSIDYAGKPIDIVLSPDHKFLYVKDTKQLLVIDTAAWTIKQQLNYPPQSGASMHGILLSRDGKTLFITFAQSALQLADIAPDGTAKWSKRITLPGREKQVSYPCGIALSPDEKRAYVCLSMNNTLAVVDLAAEKVLNQINVGVAPYDVLLSPDGATAYVSNWGGRRPRTGERTAQSADTDTLIDERGIANSGTLSILNLSNNSELDQVETGLHPSDLKFSPDFKTLYVANANSDTVSVIDVASRKVTATLPTRPDPTLPFGSASNALCLSPDAKTLYVANGGNNAVAVLPLATSNSQPAAPSGFIPTGWYPGGVATDGTHLFISNVKGIGSRNPNPENKWNSHAYRATLTKVAIPDAKTLAQYTEQVHADALVPQSLKAWERSAAGADIAPLPVPRKIGDPSLIDHVVYIIKENRTYDQLFGDIPKGNAEPKLCVFGREITPNHHAIAEQFALLDNFYCNGVLSADGHAWVTEGTTVDYLEKSMGAWSRSYPFDGDDPLAYAPTGFIWDNALLHGLSFRNYGEMSRTSTVPENVTFTEIYDDYINKTGKIKLVTNYFNANLRQYSCPDSPGWLMRIPDLIRADVFLREFEDFKRKGLFPNLTIIYLPSDHTSGTSPRNPTPAAQVADNDLALGRIVDAISHSQFWAKTAIFVIEDDPQAGFDHVDGHRSICLVVSPYTKRNAVVSSFYNQTSVLHTLELMLGLPPMNQMDAMAPVMFDVFTTKSDLTPYKHLPVTVPLNQLNPAKTALKGKALDLAIQSEELPLDLPDRADEDTLNRIVWHAQKGVDAPYPAEFAGAHGKGLKQLRLTLDANAKDDDDDD